VITSTDAGLRTQILKGGAQCAAEPHSARMDSSQYARTFQSGGAEMHGLIFVELQKYAETKHGKGTCMHC